MQRTLKQCEMQSNRVITLTTDFGYKEPFSGIMKGIILDLNPSTVVIDISHGIEKYNIREAALTIGFSYRHFPSSSIHVAVVDPGVGSQRRPILVVTDHYLFVGPDNGIFSVVYNEQERFEVLHLTAEHYFRPDRSSTFHGRDIFASAAAWLAKGVSPFLFGEPVTDFVRLAFPSPSTPTRTAVKGEVIYIDHFGNAITNIRSSDIDQLRNVKPDGTCKVVAKDMKIPLNNNYVEAEGKGLSALIDSMNYLELFVFKGNAASEYNIAVGDVVGVVVI